MSKKDLQLAKAYIQKAQSSKDRGIEFDLPLKDFKRLRAAKRCYYTGLAIGATTRTIDRIDSKRGYVVGNVVPCHRSFNGLKGMIEIENNPLTFKNVEKGIKKYLTID